MTNDTNDSISKWWEGLVMLIRPSDVHERAAFIELARECVENGGNQ